MLRKATLLLLFFVNTLTAQEGWQDWQRIYTDDKISVDIQLFISKNSCADDGLLYKYRARLNGQYRSHRQYLNWKMSYFDCNNILYYQQNSVEIWRSGGGNANEVIVESLDSRFQAISILQNYYDVETSRSPAYGSGMLPLAYAIKPDGIDTVTVANITTLKVRGGWLGPGASWHWYRNDCKGKFIRIGDTIKVDPPETTTYFVRSEGEGYKTTCVQMTVIRIRPKEEKVKEKKKKEKKQEKEEIVEEINPLLLDTIEAEQVFSVCPLALHAPTFVCRGDSAVIRIYRGILGSKAKWVWYASDSYKKRIGTGDSIVVKPNKKTTYYLRAEGRRDTTERMSVEIKILERSEEPFHIVYAGQPTVCEGAKVELEIDNFLPDDDGVFNWYADSCNGPLVGTTAFVEFYPTKTTTYFARRDSICNPYNCAAKTISIYPKSHIHGAKIVATDTVFEGEKAFLVVKGGLLGTDAQWNWYKDTCRPEKLLHTGDTLVIDIRRPTKFLAKAVGMCNETPCIELEINPFKSPGRLRKSE
jgi:hypothetical protein